MLLLISWQLVLFKVWNTSMLFTSTNYCWLLYNKIPTNKDLDLDAIKWWLQWLSLFWNITYIQKLDRRITCSPPTITCLCCPWRVNSMLGKIVIMNIIHRENQTPYLRSQDRYFNHWLCYSNKSFNINNFTEHSNRHFVTKYHISYDSWCSKV